jgi:hypothetical protein
MFNSNHKLIHNEFICLGYISQIMDNVLHLRSDHPTLKKASIYSKSILPPEPPSLIEKYTKGKERPKREEVVANRHSRFSKPALPESPINISVCICKGKCATKACSCRSKKRKCSNECGCDVAKCKNRV